MNRTSTIFLGFTLLHTPLFFATFSSSETNTDSHRRQTVNFIGTLTTFQGNTYTNIDNISIDNKFANILVIDKPDAKNMPAAEKNPKTNVMEIKLSQDPHKEYTDTRLDLKETKKIVAIPEVVYVYRPDEKRSGVELIEIKVYSNDKKQTASSYLISHKTKVRFSEKNEAGPIEKDAPIAAIKELIITDFIDQKDVKTK